MSSNFSNTTSKKVTINKEIIDNLLKDVVLPFEKIVFDDDRVKHFFERENRIKHNIALAKLAISLMKSDLEESKRLLIKASEAHNGLEFDKEILRDYLSIFFILMRRWMRKYFPDKVELYINNLLEFEKIFVEAYKPFIEIENDEFFDFDSEDIDVAINEMHYKDEHKTNALSFMSENSFDDEMVADLFDTIKEYDVDIEDRSVFDTRYIKSISKVYEKFARVFEVSYEFNDIAYSLRVLIGKLDSIDINSLSDEQKELYKTFLMSIVDDLKKWAKEVIVDQSAQDIHYLDASLLANIAQIDMMVPSESSKEDNGMDFF